jgi:putative transposase
MPGTSVGPANGTPDTPVGPTGEGISRHAGVVRRRHHLPHWQLAGSHYSITFRSGRGELPPAARLIALDTLRHDHGQKYELIAAVAMPDHVHCVVRPLEYAPGQCWDLGAIMKSVKGVSARRINQALATAGTVWHAESYDRVIRDRTEYDTYLKYMLENPVRAGLVQHETDYGFTIWPGDLPAIGLPGTPDTPVGQRNATGTPDTPVRQREGANDMPDKSVGRTDN